MKKNLKSAFNTRQYMVTKDFEVYFYDDTKLLNISDHTHDYYEYYAFLAGHVDLYIEDKAITLQPGDILLIPPHVKHRTVITETGTPYQRFVFWVSKEYAHHLLEQSSDYGYLMKEAEYQGYYLYHNDFIARNSIYSKFYELLEELKSDRFGRMAMIHLHVADLLLYLNRVAYEQTHIDKESSDSSLYEQLLSHIENHIDEDLSLDELANTFFVSKYHIAHVFKANLGISIHQYILKKRLSLCRASITSHKMIGEHYMLFGFKDYSSFYRAFKKEYGISPKDFLRSVT